MGIDMENNNSENEPEVNKKTKKSLSDNIDSLVSTQITSAEKEENNKKDFIIGMLSGGLIVLFMVISIVCILIFTGGFGRSNTRTSVKKQTIDAQKDQSNAATNETVLKDEAFIDKIMDVEDIINNYFIDDISNNDIEDGIMDGMMQALDDPYADYYSPEDLAELTSDTAGIYEGIGAYIMKDTKTTYPKITGFINGSTAKDAGMMEEDIIYKVNDEEVYEYELDEVVKRIKGPKGTTVKITVIRQGEDDTLDFTVERKKIETPTVTYEMKEDNIAYIDISEFDEITVSQFAEALDNAHADGMKGMIIDLRGNPGGSLSAVVQMCDLILPEGLVVYTEDKYGKREEYKSDANTKLDVPLVVLVNGGSASAAEIMSGAIKDYGVGTLVGTTTFGKGIVQRIIPLADGSGVKLTVSHYYTPLGNDIHKVGIEPDEVIELDSEKYLEDQTDNQLNKAVDILKKKMGN